MASTQLNELIFSKRSQIDSAVIGFLRHCDSEMGNPEGKW